MPMRREEWEQWIAHPRVDKLIDYEFDEELAEHELDDNTYYDFEDYY